MMSELEDTKARKVHSDLVCKKDTMHPACLVGRAKGFVVSFG